MTGKKNTKKKKLSLEEKQNKEAGRAKVTKILLMVFSALALVGIIVSIILGVVSCNAKKPVAFDYVNDDISKYLTIDKDKYSSFDVVLNLEEVTDADVKNKIFSALNLNKPKIPAYDGKYNSNRATMPGDEVYIWYRGYILDDDGNKVDFQGGCNFSTSIGALSALTIGSGTFVSGFESGMVDAFYNEDGTPKLNADGNPLKPKDFASFLGSTTSGISEAGQLMEITYTAVSGSKMGKDVTAIVDLSNSNLDKEYGEGFTKFLTGKPIGTKIDGNLLTRIEGDDEDSAYSSITINKVFDFEEGKETLTVDAYFPLDYQSENLRGKWAKFDVYIQDTLCYYEEYPIFDDTFVSEKLKLGAEDLKDYEGDTLADKYIAKVKAELDEEYQYKVDQQIETAMWEHYTKHVKIKKLPEDEVKSFYEGYMAQIVSEYQQYAEMYGSSYTLDMHACYSLDLNTGSDWKAELRKQAEQSVTEKLVFYYVARQENLLPTDEQMEDLYPKYVENLLNEYFKQVGCVPENYETEKEYEESKKRHKVSFDSYYSEDMLRENCIFEYAMMGISEYANLIKK